MGVKIFDETRCMLGEWLLWHPLRGELSWSDIIGNNLFSRKDDDSQYWCFAEYVSSVGWIDQNHLLIASQSAQLKFQISSGDPELFIIFLGTEQNPDGAIFDAQGNLWSAQWGAARVCKYSPEGQFLEAVKLPAEQVTCPAFGGENFSDLYLTTSARRGLDVRQLEAQEDAGKTYVAHNQAAGQEEHRIVL